jgi:hypothetical protein
MTTKLPYEGSTSGEKALVEIQKFLRNFGCNKFGSMVDDAEGTILVQFEWRGREVSVRASIKGYAAAYLKAHKPARYSSQEQDRARQKKALQIASVAVYSILRDLIKGQITAVETGILSPSRPPSWARSCCPVPVQTDRGIRDVAKPVAEAGGTDVVILIPEIETIVLLVPRTGSGSLRKAIAAKYPKSSIAVPPHGGRWRAGGNDCLIVVSKARKCEGNGVRMWVVGRAQRTIFPASTRERREKESLCWRETAVRPLELAARVDVALVMFGKTSTNSPHKAVEWLLQQQSEMTLALADGVRANSETAAKKV